jgi:hypothetical protein
MVQERIEAGACVRLIKKWLKAEVLETDGTVLHPASGTPPRGYRLARPGQGVSALGARLVGS